MRVSQERLFRWRPAPDLIWTTFEDSSDWVVFNPASGDIHLLTASARELLQILEQTASADAGALASQLAAGLNVEADAEFVAVTEETLTFLDRAGLIRPVAQ